MSIKSIFGATFVSVIAALVIYDLVVKGLVAKIANQFDDTFDAVKESDSFDHF